MVGTVSFFDGFVLPKASRIQIHLLPDWQPYVITHSISVIVANYICDRLYHNEE